MIELPRSTFYYRSTSAVDGLSEDRLVELIGNVQDELPGYGYRRVTRELQRRGHVVNHKRIAERSLNATYGGNGCPGNFWPTRPPVSS